MVFLLAAAVRAAYVLYAWSRHGAELEFPDETLHWSLARNIFARGEMVSDDGLYAARMPVYPLMLALFAWAGQGGILAARLGQALLGGLTAWMAHGFGRQALGKRAGIAAGLLVALDPYLVKFSELLLTETLFTCIGVGLAWMSWRVMSQGASFAEASPAKSVPAIPRFHASTVLVGLLGPLAVLTRPSSLGWVVLLWLVLTLTGRPLAAAARRLVSYVVLFACLMLPWGLRNRAVLGDYAWLSTNGGITLYDALGPQANGSSDQSFKADLPDVEALPEVERDRAYRDLAMKQVRKDPPRVLQLAGVKFVRTWNFVPNFSGYRGGAAAMVSAAWMLLVLGAAAIGLFRARRRWPLLIALLLPVLTFTLVHSIYIGSVRYRIPLMPFLEVLAGAAIAGSAPKRSEPRL